jgi:hypothetical protein
VGELEGLFRAGEILWRHRHTPTHINGVLVLQDVFPLVQLLVFTRYDEEECKY